MTKFLKGTAYQQDYAQQVKHAAIELCRQMDHESSGLIAQTEFFRSLGEIALSAADTQ
jgi:hypothetical protein